MKTLFVLAVFAMGAGPVRFQRHEIDTDFPGGYQVAVADVNGDGRPDVIALSTDGDRVDWYENPTWRRRPVARTLRNIDLAPQILDGRLGLALASGFYFGETKRGGQIQWLRPGANLDEPWKIHPIATDPVTHRVRWGDLDGDGRPELVHAPIFGQGSGGLQAPAPAHLWAFRLPQHPDDQPWEVWKIDETLTVLHGLYVGDLDGDGRAEILTASYEGIHRFHYQGKFPNGTWQKVRISEGAKPVSAAPGASRGSSEIVPGRLGPGRPFLAAIEPWHGHQVVVYTPAADGSWQRRVLDESLNEGHVLMVADIDGDGADEIIAGWRGKGGGLVLFDPSESSPTGFVRVEIDRALPAEGAAIADFNGDGRPDLVVPAGRAKKVVWFENLGR